MWIQDHFVCIYSWDGFRFHTSEMIRDFHFSLVHFSASNLFGWFHMFWYKIWFLLIYKFKCSDILCSFKFRCYVQNAVTFQINMKIWWIWLSKFMEMLHHWKNAWNNSLPKSGFMERICINVMGMVASFLWCSKTFNPMLNGCFDLMLDVCILVFYLLHMVWTEFFFILP